MVDNMASHSVSHNASVVPQATSTNNAYIPYIAANRFSFGVDAYSRSFMSSINSIEDAQKWLIAQLDEYRLVLAPEQAQQWSSQQALTEYQAYRILEKTAVDNDTKNQYKVVRKQLIEQAKSYAEQTALANINHPQALQSRLLDFFSNHFSVSRQNLRLNLLCPTIETEAIAPYLHLSFEDMLIAVIQHPAMLLYLNNERSMGPNSKIVKRQIAKQNKRIGGLNENLAREILELHTLGVKAAYTQTDVIELAKAISGWGVGRVDKQEPAGFKFTQNAHEPGARQILGKSYSAKNEIQGLAILRDLAQHRSSAQHICFKLAKHFISDTPSKALLESMTATWLSTQANIPAVVQALIKHPDSWNTAQRKFKTPREFVVSACRACDIDEPSPSLFSTLEILGQGLFNAGSPAGYADEQQAWLGASALNARIEWASHFANVVLKQHNKNSTFSPTRIAQQALGPYLTNVTLNMMQRAESKQQAIALFLLSPEFMRR